MQGSMDFKKTNISGWLLASTNETPPDPDKDGLPICLMVVQMPSDRRARQINWPGGNKNLKLSQQRKAQEWSTQSNTNQAMGPKWAEYTF